VRSALIDKPVGPEPRRRVALIAAATLAISVLGSQAAFAQSGGVGAPGTTTTTDPTTTTAPAGSMIYPVAGAHTFGDGFGAARKGHTHQGQDIMAACGTPLLATRGGTVKFASTQALAGNYVVLSADDRSTDYVYMHLRDRALVKKGDTVVTGQPIGFVGQTGDATACHLHFELWPAPGWYTGGHPVDPLPSLKAWDVSG